MVSWLVAGLALLLALRAVASARLLSRRIDTLTQSYWELRYDYTRLRSQLARLDPEAAEPAAGQDGAPGPEQASASVTFVPLASIRKKKIDGE